MSKPQLFESLVQQLVPQIEQALASAAQQKYYLENAGLRVFRTPASLEVTPKLVVLYDEHEAVIVRYEWRLNSIDESKLERTERGAQCPVSFQLVDADIGRA